MSADVLGWLFLTVAAVTAFALLRPGVPRDEPYDDDDCHDDTEQCDHACVEPWRPM